MKRPMVDRNKSDAIHHDGSPGSKTGGLPKPLDNVLQATTRRLQLRSVLIQLKPDWDSVTLAIKGSIPPTVLVCAIQSRAWIDYFKTNAYLAPIIATCALPALPRARLIEHNVRLAFAFTISYCWALLAGWSGLQARKHTTHSPEAMEAYNSSAEAVVALFLMFGIWCAFSLKSAYPAWALQCTLAGIFIVAILPTLARAPSMTKILAESRNTLESFLAGQAVGFVNALVVFPRTCRGVFKKDLRACLDGLVSVMQAQRKCVDDLKDGTIDTSSSVAKLQAALQRFINGVVKARSDVEYAEREISWGRLDHAQLEQIASMLVDLIPPVSGLSSTADMLQIAIPGHVPSSNIDGTDGQLQPHDTLEDENAWHHLEEKMNRHSLRISEAIGEGVEHAKLRLELTRGSPVFDRIRKKKRPDEEKPSYLLGPGQARFLELYQNAFNKWCFMGEESDSMNEEKLVDSYIRHRPQITDLAQVTTKTHTDTRRYFLLLHSQALLSSVGDELLKLLIFVEECHSQPKRLLIPRLSHLNYWYKISRHLFDVQETSTSNDMEPHTKVQLGSGFFSHKNPDHLPPTNLMEKIGDRVRSVSAALHTDHAAYGLRGVCAVMTIVIIGFLHRSQDFYFKERFLWALFAILLSMSRTAGTSTFLLLGRIVGTMASMVASYLIWYITDKKTPGILVFLWVWFLILGYVVAKFPKVFGIYFVALIAAIVMSANELQVRQLGKATVEKLGQSVYPPYIIFPYRLAVVTLGVLTAYFWTIFPYPLAEHSELREHVAKSMYMLAAYYITVERTILARIAGTYGSVDDEKSPCFHLQNSRRAIFRKYQTVTNTAKTYFQFLDWEFALGGRFPKQAYGEMLPILERLGSYMTLASYVSRALDLRSLKCGVDTSSVSSSSWWLDDTTGTVEAHLVPKGITTRLIVLHSALSRAHRLPPELKELAIPTLSEFLTHEVPADQGFAAAALIHTVNWYMMRDLNRLTELVRDLVGELDFSVSFGVHDGLEGGESTDDGSGEMDGEAADEKV